MNKNIIMLNRLIVIISKSCILVYMIVYSAVVIVIDIIADTLMQITTNQDLFLPIIITLWYKVIREYVVICYTITYLLKYEFTK